MREMHFPVERRTEKGSKRTAQRKHIERVCETKGRAFDPSARDGVGVPITHPKLRPDLVREGNVVVKAMHESRAERSRRR